MDIPHLCFILHAPPLSLEKVVYSSLYHTTHNCTDFHDKGEQQTCTDTHLFDAHIWFFLPPPQKSLTFALYTFRFTYCKFKVPIDHLSVRSVEACFNPFSWIYLHYPKWKQCCHCTRTIFPNQSYKPNSSRILLCRGTSPFQRLTTNFSPVTDTSQLFFYKKTEQCLPALCTCHSSRGASKATKRYSVHYKLTLYRWSNMNASSWFKRHDSAGVICLLTIKLCNSFLHTSCLSYHY